MNKTAIIVSVICLCVTILLLNANIEIDIQFGAQESNDLTVSSEQSGRWSCTPNLVTNLFHDGFIRELTMGLEDSGIVIDPRRGWKYSFQESLQGTCSTSETGELVTCVAEDGVDTGAHYDVIRLDTEPSVYNHTQIRFEGTTFTSGTCLQIL